VVVMTDETKVTPSVGAPRHAAAPPAASGPSTKAAAKEGAWRSVCTWFLVVVACLMVPLSLIARWGVHTVNDQASYVAALTPLESSPAVQNYVSSQVTDHLIDALKAKGPPISVVAESQRVVVQSETDHVIASPSFTQIWARAVRGSHAVLYEVFNGQVKTGAPVTVDLTPITVSVINTLRNQGNQLFDTVSPETSIKIGPKSNLTSARDSFSSLTMLSWLLPLAGIAAMVGAVAISRKRLRIVIVIAIGSILTSALTLAAITSVVLAIDRNVTTVNSQRAATVAFYDALTKSLITNLIVASIMGAVVAIGAGIWLSIVARRSKSPAEGQTGSAAGAHVRV
jgi:hypothetical protein